MKVRRENAAKVVAAVDRIRKTQPFECFNCHQPLPVSAPIQDAWIGNKEAAYLYIECKCTYQNSLWKVMHRPDLHHNGDALVELPHGCPQCAWD